MAAAREILQEMLKEITCSICRNYISEPVIMGCGHSFCQACLSQSRRVETSFFSCPDCGHVTQLREFPGVNEHIAQMPDLGKQLSCQLLQSTEGQNQSATHKEVLFCEEEGCHQTPEHEAHALSPVEEAAHNYREKFQHIQNPLGKHFEETEKSPTQEENPAGNWESKITGEYSERWKFLPEDEESQCLERLDQEQRASWDRHQRQALHHFLLDQQEAVHQPCEDDKELGARSQLVSPSQFSSPRYRMIMGTRSRGKGDGRYLPWFLRKKQEEEEQVYLLHHPQIEEEEEGGKTEGGGEEQLQTSDPQDEARREEAPLFASFPANYQPLKEQLDGGKPQKKYRKKLQKYGKNLGKAIAKGCLIGLQDLAKANEAAFPMTGPFFSMCP